MSCFFSLSLSLTCGGDSSHLMPFSCLGCQIRLFARRWPRHEYKPVLNTNVFNQVQWIIKEFVPVSLNKLWLPLLHCCSLLSFWFSAIWLKSFHSARYDTRDQTLVLGSHPAQQLSGPNGGSFQNTVSVDTLQVHFFSLCKHLLTAGAAGTGGVVMLVSGLLRSQDELVLWGNISNLCVLAETKL